MSKTQLQANNARLEALIETLKGKAVGGGASVQSDWSQNDETALDYVKNRTHYEIPPEFDIHWDGDMTGRFAMPLDSLGYPGEYLVKIDDLVLAPEEMVGAKVHRSIDEADSYFVLDEESIDGSMLPGLYFINGLWIVVVYEQAYVNAALGLPEGTITNGVYFSTDEFYESYTDHFIGKTILKTLNDKYIPESIARITDVERLILGAIEEAY